MAMSSKQPDHFSYSQIMSFNKCRYLYHLSYIRGIERVARGSVMDVGSAFHAGIASHLRGEGHVIGVEAWADDIIGTAWRFAQSSEMDLIHDDEDEEDHFSWGDDQVEIVAGIVSKVKLLLAYYIPELDRRFDVVVVEGVPFVEREITHQYGTHKFVGRVDCILKERATGHDFIVDFKLKSALTTEEPIGDFDSQLALYQHVMRVVYGVEVVGSIQYQMRSIVPQTPDLLKSGKALSRTSIATTWDHYRAAMGSSSMTTPICTPS